MAGMRDGFWLNIYTGVWSQITEHATWIRDPKNAGRIGLSDSAIAKIAPLDTVSDRVKIVIVAMEDGLARIRGNGGTLTVEFTRSIEPLGAALSRFLPAAMIVDKGLPIILRDLKKREQLTLRLGDLLILLQDKHQQVSNRMVSISGFQNEREVDEALAFAGACLK